MGDVADGFYDQGQEVIFLASSRMRRVRLSLRVAPSPMPGWALITLP